MEEAVAAAKEAPCRVLTPYAQHRVPDRAGFTRTELFEIYSCRFWGEETCHWLISEVESHVQIHGWDVQRHRTYPTTDIGLLSVPSLRQWMQGELRTAILPTLGALYGFNPETELKLQDLFFVKVRGGRGGGRG
jgi:hypothetical protein